MALETFQKSPVSHATEHGNGQHSHAMATRAMAGGVARLARRRWAKAAAGKGSTAASRAGRSQRGRRRGKKLHRAARGGTGGPERQRGGVPVD